MSWEKRKRNLTAKWECMKPSAVWKIFERKCLIPVNGTLMRRIYKTLAMNEEELRNRFSPTELEIVKFHFGITTGNPQTLEDTAAKFNTNVDRIKQIEAKFIRKANRQWENV